MDYRQSVNKKSHKVNSVKKAAIDGLKQDGKAHRSPVPSMGNYKHESFRQPNLNHKGFSANSDSLRGNGAKIRSDKTRDYINDRKTGNMIQKYQLEKRISTSVSTKSKTSSGYAPISDKRGPSGAIPNFKKTKAIKNVRGKSMKGKREGSFLNSYKVEE